MNCFNISFGFTKFQFNKYFQEFNKCLIYYADLKDHNFISKEQIYFCIYHIYHENFSLVIAEKSMKNARVLVPYTFACERSNVNRME